MDKPIVFFSHSSRDAEALIRLRELFIQKTDGTIDVFLSSDGESIPFGRNWVHRVEQALDQAKLMVVFVTPNSVGSQWLYFEAGYAYNKGLRVVPVGFRGIDLTALTPPLGLLQGFNITSQDSLDNLISLVNEEFNHKHQQNFTKVEYDEIFSLGESMATLTLGQLGEQIDNISVRLNSGSDFSEQPKDLLPKIADILKKNSINVQVKEAFLNYQGVSIGLNTMPTFIEFMIDPELFHLNAHLLSEIIKSIRPTGFAGVSLLCQFNNGIDALVEQYKISARLYGTPVTLHESEGFSFRDLRFSIRHSTNMRMGAYPTSLKGPTYVSIIVEADEIPVEQIKELFDILLTKHVVFFTLGGYVEVSQ
jgi:hypothetical protein